MDEQNTNEKKVKKVRVPKEPKVPKEKKTKKILVISSIELEPEPEPEPEPQTLSLEVPQVQEENVILPDTPPTPHSLTPPTQDVETQTDEDICICCEQPIPTKQRKKDNPNYNKEYYAQNKERICKIKEAWRKNNPDKVNTEKKREYQKKYDTEHKDQIKARREKLIVCECGEEIKAYSIVKHRKSKTHLLKIELKIAKGDSVVPVETEFDETSSSEEK